MFENSNPGSVWVITLVIVALDIAAIAQVWRTGFGSVAKLAWTALVVLFPILGALAWFVCSAIIWLFGRLRPAGQQVT